jgi:hypothetical protein
MNANPTRYLLSRLFMRTLFKDAQLFMTFYFICSSHIARYQMVWKTTLYTYHEMTTAEGWAEKDVVDVPVMQAVTSKVKKQPTSPWLCQ